MEHVLDVCYYPFYSGASDNVIKVISLLDSLLFRTISKSLLICFGVNHKVYREIFLIYSLIYIQKILLHSNQDLSTWIQSRNKSFLY